VLVAGGSSVVTVAREIENIVCVAVVREVNVSLEVEVLPDPSSATNRLPEISTPATTMATPMTR